MESDDCLIKMIEINFWISLFLMNKEYEECDKMFWNIFSI